MGGACGLGTTPTPAGPPEVGSRCATYTQIPPGCTPRLQWGSVVARCSTAVTAGFFRGRRDPVSHPVTTNNQNIWIRAAAGIGSTESERQLAQEAGSTCSPGASPTRTSGSRLALYQKQKPNPRKKRGGCSLAGCKRKIDPLWVCKLSPSPPAPSPPPPACDVHHRFACTECTCRPASRPPSFR
jgi:hypothetical protein